MWRGHDADVARRGADVQCHSCQVGHRGLVAELRKEIEAKRNEEKRVAEVMESMKAELGGRDWPLPAEVRAGRREKAEVGTATWQLMVPGCSNWWGGARTSPHRKRSMITL